MKHLRARKPSPAMVVAILALGVSLVGTAVAGPIAEISLSKGEKKQVRKLVNKRITQRAPGLSVASANLASLANSVANDSITSEKIKDAGVTSADLADAAVTLAKLADNSVNSAKVVADSLTAADLAPNSVGSSEIAPSAVGSSEIATSAVGSSELAGITLVTKDSDEVADGATAGVTATCPAGTQVISGGFDTESAGLPWRLQRSVRDGNGWRAFGTNQTGGDSFLIAHAYCLQL